MGYQILKIANMGQSSALKSDVLLIFWLPYVLQKWFELEECLRMLPFKWYMSQPSKMFIFTEIMHQSQWC